MRYDKVQVEDIPKVIRELLRNNTVEITLKEGSLRTPKELKKGLLITGITGSGKTHCVYAIRKVLNDWGDEPNISKVENWVDFLFELKERMSSKEGGGLRNTINSLISPKYVFIDDLGAENDTNWGREMLYLVINGIYIKEKILFLTTNLTMEELSKQYGDRIVDRLSELCEIVAMPDHNYRE